VDETEVWNSVPLDLVANHCGGVSKYYHPECRNSNSIGVEICMNDKQGKIRQKSIDHAAELIRELMDRYDIPVENVVRHYDVTHKHCPGPMVDNPALWAEFKRKLEEKKMANDKPSAWAADAWEKATKAGVVDGTRPTEPITRQEIVVILDRLKLIK
jgi:N-acetylmuramoyl-L-alanine amidase CwlA